MISQENRICQNCKNSFTIESDDFNFYQKISVPPPTWCMECRQLRRYAWRNERTLYRRNCDLCGKSMVTIYSPNKPYKVYCHTCWWGDDWDFALYGRDFDFTRPFFEQFQELQLQVPRMALLNKNSVNSEYTNHSGDNKNVYLSFSCFNNENVFYSTWVMKSRDCVDCSYIYEAGEKLYECIDSQKSYKSQFGVLLSDCINCYYCYDCRSCTDCFMSSNLRNKSYVFKNKQYSREEYLTKVNELKLTSYLERKNLYKEFLNLIKSALHRYSISKRNINSSGNMLFNSKNAKICFDGYDMEDSSYIFSALDIKNCMDLYHVGINTELAYENHGCTRVSNCQFCHLCYDNMNVMYSDTCQNSQNIFGCISIKRGEYMIFNKKYNKEEYLMLKEKIIKHMRKTGEYGEFFPPSIAPVCYNETQGQFYNPMSKEEVLEKGWQWEDQLPGTFRKETIKPEDIPDDIAETPNDLSQAIFRCLDCSRNYNLKEDEFNFYKQEKIPLPRLCSNCRYAKRFDLRLPRKLWHRQCMCDKTSHHNHLDIRCPNEFETSYAPERPEIIYCEKCYQQEVY